MDFKSFARQTEKSFQRIIKQPEVFIVDVGKNELFKLYLESFPEGTNPIFKTHTWHDCSCCKQFILNVGHVIAIKSNGSAETVWDEAAKKAEEPYRQVAKALQALVRQSDIVGIFRVAEGGFGTQKSFSEDDEGNAVTWNHFYTGKIPRRFRPGNVGTVRGKYRTTVHVYQRGLNELQSSAVTTVLELIQSNSLYRGAEHKASVLQFRKDQTAYNKLGRREKQFFVWKAAHGPAARFRNTVIGTLVQDLSDGIPLERAVASFESKVAPQNYKRTTALITPGMVKAAMETIQSLDLEPALERRFARIDDVSVNDVLWVDSSVKPLMKDGLSDLLMKQTTTKRKEVDITKAEPIDIDDFIEGVLPEATTMELLLRSEHLGNLMSLTAPVYEEPKQLFQWQNDFAWSYNGNVADSIKERVKKAGGNVSNAQLRISLSWFNYDDLDIHITELGTSHIRYSSKRGQYGGVLDVDMNVTADTREAVENVSWASRVQDGLYEVYVHNYNKRESIDVGFVIEIENSGKLIHLSYPKAVRNAEKIHVCTVRMKDNRIDRIDMKDSIASSAVSQEKWGLQTEKFVKINAVTFSPNYWGDNAVGNKHTFFVLDGAVNDEPTRGIYNEFLHSRLTQHRKVFEIIGEKTKCQPTEGQLSGVGFSSTRSASVLVKVTQGRSQRLFNVQIGA